MIIPRLNLRYDVSDSLCLREDNEIEIISAAVKCAITQIMGLSIREIILVPEFAQRDCNIYVGYDEDPSMLFRFSDDGWFVLETELTEIEYHNTASIMGW